MASLQLTRYSDILSCTILIGSVVSELKLGKVGARAAANTDRLVPTILSEI
jgi:hypothetical protein